MGSRLDTTGFRSALVLRPEPGASVTAARLAALGVPVRRCPLFVVAPVAWPVPVRGGYDALLLTSANAARHAGPGLRTLADLPVLAVGEATATAARDAGLSVTLTGDTDAANLLATARARGFDRPLHLAGRERISLAGVDRITVYASDAAMIDARAAGAWAGQVALLHSPRAARRFAELIDRFGVDRDTIDIAALSRAVAAAVGHGWRSRGAVPQPDDALLVALARRLIDPLACQGDKWSR